MIDKKPKSKWEALFKSIEENAGTMGAFSAAFSTSPIAYSFFGIFNGQASELPPEHLFISTLGLLGITTSYAITRGSNSVDREKQVNLPSQIPKGIAFGVGIGAIFYGLFNNDGNAIQIGGVISAATAFLDNIEETGNKNEGK